MTLAQLREYCLLKKNTEESFPFDKHTLVFKVMGKMFALTDTLQFDFINLKCNPEYALELREKHHDIQPGYHMHKAQWNSVKFNSELNDEFIFQLIDHSYEEVVNKFPKKLRDIL